MTKKQTPLTMCHASAAAQHGQPPAGHAPGARLLQKGADGLEPEHPEADERPPPEVGVIEPLTAFDQQQRLGQRDGEGEKLNR